MRISDGASRQKIETIRPRTLDRMLLVVRCRHGHRGLSGTRHGDDLLKNVIPIKISHRDVNRPGFIQADTVAHGGDSTEGDFVWSLTFTDIFTNRDMSVEMTRTRPGQKNDNPHVEQKNYTHVRLLPGYQRIENPDLVQPINRLYKDCFGNVLFWRNAFRGPAPPPLRMQISSSFDLTYILSPANVNGHE